MKKQKFSGRLSSEFTDFPDTVNVKRLNRNLRNMLLAYLNQSVSSLPQFHADLLYDLEFLFTFLDGIEKEQKKWRHGQLEILRGKMAA